jgi:hypothetical protein
MHALWADRRRATVTFAVICAGLFVFPMMMRWTAEYYISHPVVIPNWLRTIMLMSAIVRSLRLPMALVAALVLFGMSSRNQRLDPVRRSING